MLWVLTWLKRRPVSLAAADVHSDRKSSASCWGPTESRWHLLNRTHTQLSEVLTCYYYHYSSMWEVKNSRQDVGAKVTEHSADNTQTKNSSKRNDSYIQNIACSLLTLWQFQNRSLKSWLCVFCVCAAYPPSSRDESEVYCERCTR